MKSDILRGNVEGQMVVTREAGGTLMADSADGSSTIALKNPLVSMSEKQRQKLDRKVRGIEATGAACACPDNGVYRRGNPSKVCLRCGGTRGA